MPSKPFFLGGRFFAKKGDLKEYLSLLWGNAILGDPLPPEDAAIIRDLLALHPRADNKIGCGIEYLYVDKSPDLNNNCFYIMRTDGNRTDFSINKCLNGDSSAAMFKAACRSAVEDQINEFKDNFLISDEGKDLVIRQELIHIDHESPTFDHLVGKFFNILGLPLSGIAFSGIGEDNSSKIAFEDPSISERFAEFHRNNAKLRGVTKRQNLSDNKKGVRKTRIAEDFSVYVKPEEWNNLIFK